MTSRAPEKMGTSRAPIEIAYRSIWFSIEREPSTKILRYRRHSEPFGTAEEIIAVYEQMQQALIGVVRRDWRLLLDIREGPLRNDEQFETVTRRYRKELLTGFDRVAMLVKTAVGRLQLARLFREEGVTHAVFDDEAEAIASLLGPKLSLPPSK